MTEEAKYLLAPFIGVLAVVALATWLEPFEPPFGFFVHTPGAPLGWSALALGVMSVAYSARKRVFLQGLGPLIYWKGAHVAAGYIFVVLFVLHANGKVGLGAQFLLTTVSAGIVITGLWGIIRQGHVPQLMTKTLVNPVYKSELADAVNVALKEISEMLEGRSKRFDEVYQRHILPFISIKYPTLSHHKAMLQRCFGPATLDPNAAVIDVADLDVHEKDIFYSIAEKAVDALEIRVSQTHQRQMNRWLLWHIGLSLIIAVALFFHVLAAFYY
ncbi:MAG: hypothetical protein HY751_10640 [Nitrospinae bacterium]|nr:hypothetical protein [Nitrospinota bacterium]